MHKDDQPKTTNEEPVRDAAVQIDEEIQNAYAKADEIWKGAVMEEKREHNRTAESTYLGAGYGLALVLMNLTSSNKFDRERAKKRVRELVKLGQEAGK